MPNRYDVYVEPFAGSATLFFTLETAPAILGDINPLVCCLYSELKRNPKAVIRELGKLPADGAAYYRVRSSLHRIHNRSRLAAHFLYLNRFSFNGIYRTNQAGRFNVPRGAETGELPTRDHLEAAAELLQGATIICGDFARTLALAGPGDVAYLDPPYESTAHRDQQIYGLDKSSITALRLRVEKAVDELSERRVSWVLSYPAAGGLTMDRIPHKYIKRRVARLVAAKPAKRRDVYEKILYNA